MPRWKSCINLQTVTNRIMSAMQRDHKTEYYSTVRREYASFSLSSGADINETAHLYLGGVSDITQRNCVECSHSPAC